MKVVLRLQKKCLVLVFIVSFIISAQGQEKIFKAGAYAANITPPLGLKIVGNYIEPEAVNIHDDLYAKCLVLDDSQTQLVFVIIDNVSIHREVLDAAKKMIHERTGIPMENMLMSAVHNHSATSANGEGERRRGYNVGRAFEEYQLFLIGRIADGVQSALHRLEPAEIGWGVGSVPEHVFNRRWIMKEPVMNPWGGYDIAQMNPPRGSKNLMRPAGPTDPQVPFISVRSKEGRPISLLANYSLHYVGGVPAGDISGDYFAAFAERIHELLQSDRPDSSFVGILTNGTSGDINNINFLPGTSPEKFKAYEKIKIVASDVAQEVFRVYQNIEHHDWVRLDVAQSELRLGIRQATPEMLKSAREILSRPETDPPLYHRLEKIYAKRVIQMDKEWPSEVDIILQTFRIGDLGIAAIPFEVFAETGLEIKARSPFHPSFTIELANGGLGYLPTPEQHQLGGYETWYTANRVETQATVKIVDELMRLFSNLE